jgi:hypothetical protein
MQGGIFFQPPCSLIPVYSSIRDFRVSIIFSQSTSLSDQNIKLLSKFHSRPSVQNYQGNIRFLDTSETAKKYNPKQVEDVSSQKKYDYKIVSDDYALTTVQPPTEKYTYGILDNQIQTSEKPQAKGLSMFFLNHFNHQI